jgi:hypothetical protein
VQAVQKESTKKENLLKPNKLQTIFERFQRLKIGATKPSFLLGLETFLPLLLGLAEAMEC